jgi:hypothetical protein
MVETKTTTHTDKESLPRDVLSNGPNNKTGNVRVTERNIVTRRQNHCCCVCDCECTGAGVCLRACSLTNPACNVPPYRHLRPLWLHHIFRHHLTHGTSFGIKLLNIKCVFSFSLQLLFETILILRRIQRDIVINVKTSSCKVLGFLF